MATTPLPSTPDLPRLAFDRRVCVAANRWGTRRAVGAFFGIVSRLGDGMFWYALMLALAAMDGRRGCLAAAHMAATGVIALKLKLVEALKAAPGESFTAEQLAEKAGAADKAEIAFKILEHLAANKNTGVKKRAKTPVTNSLYRLG